MPYQFSDVPVGPSSRGQSARRIVRCLLFGSIFTVLMFSTATGQRVRFTTHPYWFAGMTQAPAPLNEEYIYDADATASNGGEIRYVLRKGPTGMKVDQLTGVVSWRPDRVGGFVVELEAYLLGNLSPSAVQKWIVAVPGRLDYLGRKRISGSVFHDANGNCVREQEEGVRAREIVEILPGPIYATTGDAGIFTALLAPGAYVVNGHPKRHWTLTCPDSEGAFSVPDSSGGNIALAVRMIPGIYDVRTSLSAGPARPGFDISYTLFYENVGTEPATGKVRFEYDDRLSYKSSTESPGRHVDNRLEWDFANLDVGGWNSITIVLTIPRTLQRGTELCATTDVRLDRKDDREFLGDNRDSVCTRVTGSYDPNDISVAPGRFDEEMESMALLPGDTVLSYLVRFQNTGNDTAFTVIVTDTLDPALLDITTVEPGAASHPFTFDISGSGALTWTFDNILLPDSGTNELASHGYFKYSVHLRKGLPVLTPVSNRAAIYFDFNDPVITNTVVSLTGGTLSVTDETAVAKSMLVYPNPSEGTSSIRLRLTESAHVKLRLADAKGEVVAVLQNGRMDPGDHTLPFDPHELPSGSYYLILDREGVKEVHPLVVSR